MCGIWTFIKLAKEQNLDISKLFQDFWNIKMRGPDNSYLENYNNVWVGFHRLAIMDLSFASNQPYVLQQEDKTIVFICNGEIYNFKHLIEKYDLPIQNNSDCMTIPELYLKYTCQNKLDKFLELFENEIKGEFAFVLFEFDKLQNLRMIMAGRDQIGIRPLYYHDVNENSNGIIFSSEVKGTNNFKDKIEEFPPGTIKIFHGNNFLEKKTFEFKLIYNIEKTLNSEEIFCTKIKDSIVNAVKLRLDADRPLAFLLSGGVDSSLVAGISAKILGKPIRTFCCGMNEGTDLFFARKVANHIGSIHTEVFFTPEEGLAAINDVIWTIESWDTTTVRASVGQYLVSKYIGQNTDAKVVLVGEGPDEVCSSYLFNWYAPDDSNSIHNTAKEYVDKIHYYDGRRADRCVSRWGLEGRVPLLDPDFISEYWKIPSEQRHPKFKNMEKWWLRKAFEGENIIPDEVLWRKKEAFSDGVSSKEKSWFQIIQEYIEPLVSNEEMLNAKLKYSFCTPQTKEAYYYRKLFCDFFGENRQTILPNYWQPKWDIKGNEITEYVDPSARTLKIYN
jgi:asparagine synthase (glutamine-hydrolysing)